ncbi:EamA/RhaT family transporter [Ascidiimonas aurantiaca]|uniref:EamA/RhaT family transporter n=1 Tax=Ascidiimonas aurantiaca TaxID=1685432 RepID=UPI0030EB9BBE
MGYVILSILSNTLLFVIFKAFTKYRIHNLHAIVINYFTAASIGFFRASDTTDISQIIYQDWFYGTVLLGVIFFSLFNVLALTSQKGGVAMASVASKMSVVIPVTFAFIVFDETVTLLKIGGILIALLAVYMVSRKRGEQQFEISYWYLPVLLFFGSGILDTILKFLEHRYVNQDQTDIFATTIFFMAGISGTLFLTGHYIAKKPTFHLKNMVAGILLGIPNYFSVYFIVMALKTNGLESSVIFPVNNVGVVMVSTLSGVFLFKEQLSGYNKVGIILAIFGIILMSFN